MQEALSIPSHPYEQPTAVSVSPELELGGSGVTQISNGDGVTGLTFYFSATAAKKAIITRRYTCIL